MKKAIYSLIVAAVLTGCNAAPEGYTIQGAAQDAIMNGQTVYLSKMVSRDYVPVDSAVVVNGKFQFKGIQAQPAIRFVGIKGGKSTPLVLENSAYNILLGENPTVTGAALNDSLQRFLADVDQLPEEAFGELSRRFVKAHLSNPAGAYVFFLNRGTFSPEEQKEMIEASGELFRADDNVTLIKAKLDAMEKVAVGKKFIDLSMPDPTGKEMKLSDYCGKNPVVLIDFWASWCPPCRASMPGLIKLYEKYHKQGFEIVGVSFDKTNEAWLKGIEELKLPWPQMSDLKFWNSTGASTYAVRGIPHGVLVNREGIIVAKDLEGEELDAKVKELLKN